MLAEVGTRTPGPPGYPERPIETESSRLTADGGEKGLLARLLRLNQSMTFLAALLEAVGLAADGVAPAANASEVVMDGLLGLRSVGCGERMRSPWMIIEGGRPERELAADDPTGATGVDIPVVEMGALAGGGGACA
jgi:hypothetical protein